MNCERVQFLDIIVHIIFIISGSTAQLSGDTTMRAGSLLDDNQWHEVEITRDERRIVFNVDRMNITNVSSSDFLQLDLDRKVGINYILLSYVTSHTFSNCSNV